jgi:hypothetical protein
MNLEPDGRKRVFVLGAGFSAQGGFPLARNLREQVIASLPKMHLEPEIGGFPQGQFHAGLEAVEQGRPLQFEELLIALQRRTRSTLDDLDPCFVTLDALREGCFRLFWGRQGKIRALPECYSNFGGWVYNWYRPGPRNAVVTFNWDLLVERALQRGWSYWRGDDRKVPVLKPHGSINWLGHLRGNPLSAHDRCSSITPESNLCFPVPDALENWNVHGFRPDLTYMIFPGDPDLPEVDNDLRLIWSDVASVISSADLVVFIGYSLPDYDSYAPRFFQGITAGKEIEVCNPSEADLKKYVALFAERAKLERVTFESCRYASRPDSWKPRSSRS